MQVGVSQSPDWHFSIHFGVLGSTVGFGHSRARRLLFALPSGYHPSTKELSWYCSIVAYLYLETSRRYGRHNSSK